MTTNDDHGQESEPVTATTAEAPAEAPRKNDPQPIEPIIVPHAFDAMQELEPTPEFKSRIKALIGKLPYDEAQDQPVPHDDLEQLRRETYTQMWRNSLTAAHAEDLAEHRLADLAADQHGPFLAKYVDSIGPDSPVLNLILGGRVGSGKTSAAIAAGNHAADRGLMVRFVQHATYLRWLRPDGAPNNMPDWQIRKRFRDMDLLILDDLGAGLDLGEPATKFVRDETTALIGDRIDTSKATIITTNVRAEDLEVMIDDRLVSRLSKRGHALRFTGQDRRGRLSW